MHMARSSGRAGVLHRGEPYPNTPSALQVGVRQLRALPLQRRLRERENVDGGFMPKEKKLQPPQHQDRQPGREYKMKPRPRAKDEKHRGSGKLQGMVAIITGGDSGIGRAIAITFAKEGADVAVIYLEEHKDAKETRRLVEKEGGKCLLIDGDVGEEDFCRKAVAQTARRFGGIDILVNNAAEQHLQDSIEKITARQLERTFRTNIFSFFFMTKAAMKHLKKGATIINTTSVTAY